MRKISSHLSQDWHPEQVKAAIRMRGVTLTQLAEDHGFDRTAITKTLSRRWPSVEAVIAGFLGTSPQAIWPSRYDAAGNPKRQRSDGKRMVNARLRQKSQAA